jgi:hypothetical protein
MHSSIACWPYSGLLCLALKQIVHLLPSCLVVLPLPLLISCREDTAWVYDPKSSSLLIFGGWASRWLGDLVKLNVSAIIGPPYACTSKPWH